MACFHTGLFFPVTGQFAPVIISTDPLPYRWMLHFALINCRAYSLVHVALTSHCFYCVGTLYLELLLKLLTKLAQFHLHLSLSSLLWRPRNLCFPHNCLLSRDCLCTNDGYRRPPSCQCDQMQDCEGGCETIYDYGWHLFSELCLLLYGNALAGCGTLLW